MSALSIESLFQSGRIVDLILVLMVVEAALLAVFRYRTGRKPALGHFIGSLLAGAFLLLALRVALTDGSWRLIAALLGAALMSHLLDLSSRWRS